MDFWKIFPAKAELLKWFEMNGDGKTRLVNAHMHTPYSFSAFTGISQALNMAVNENVKVAGINDFYTTDGYSEWAEACASRKIFPLFNIEYISLNRDDQAAGIRVNDPNNPGRTYLSGKGLAFPSKLEEPYASQLESVRQESNLQVQKMCIKLNEVLANCNANFLLDFEEIKSNMTKGMVRERHLAKALREKINYHFASAEDQQFFYKAVFGGKALKSDIDNFAAIENEIRGNLLKAGGAAFIPESHEAFLDMEMVCRIILNSGGIPTYPFLADDNNGNFTDFEAPKETVIEILRKRNICSVEFITTRNSIATLEEYADYFNKNGFVVTFGTEHNTPAMEPVKLFARNNTPLSKMLLKINYEGACIIAAHQYLVATEGSGYLEKDCKPDLIKRDYYTTLGKALIEYLTKN
ncbi:MAG: hypothetical protein NTY07_06565 [Bacteroidia bacterium]|nr:hypothetical protein [Bacteroidia bacterium]